jgi:hypothetical protein
MNGHTVNTSLQITNICQRVQYANIGSKQLGTAARCSAGLWCFIFEHFEPLPMSAAPARLARHGAICSEQKRSETQNSIYRYLQYCKKFHVKLAYGCIISWLLALLYTLYIYLYLLTMTDQHNCWSYLVMLSGSVVIKCQCAGFASRQPMSLVITCSPKVVKLSYL